MKYDKIHLVHRTVEVGPRKVTRVAGIAAVYLGKHLDFLIGRYVLLTVKVLEEPSEASSNAA